MDAERWDRIRELFHAAIDRPPDSRGPFLDANCEDAAIRAEVESLLSSANNSLDALDRPAFEQVRGALRPGVLSKSGAPLAAGDKVGSYQIQGLLGAGGMGEVYRARDLKLKREVALKVLPPAFSGDFERMTRFRREAEVLASLNHPNIAQIYGLENSALVMELVEGSTLSSPLPVRTALSYARQMAEALEYAHERGVIHRDLKPANIKITPQGVLKVLDFGLAKVADRPAPASGDPSLSPTETMSATETGMILGTAAYMSPEQASSKPVDKRADIWSFGVVLWEMLTGTRLFQSESVAHTLADVLRAEIDFNKLPRETPPPIRELLVRCLDRDATTRLRDLGEARILIQKCLAHPASGTASAVAAPPLAPPKGPRFWVAWGLAAVFAMVAVASLLQTGRVIDRQPALSLTIVPPSRKQLFPVGDQSSEPEISPDGSAVLYAVFGDGYYVRRLDSFESKFVPGSQAISGAAFWSADSTTIAYPELRQLIKIRMPDGAPQAIMPLQRPTRGGSWSLQGGILLFEFPLITVAPSGGQPAKVEIPGLPPGAYKSPEFLPDSRDFLFLFVPDDNGQETEVCLATLQDGKGINVARLFKNPTAAHYTEAGGGRVLFVRDDNLYSQKLNRSSRRIEGEPELVVTGVASQPNSNIGRADFSVSRQGVLAWRPGRAALNQVTAFDRAGNVVATSGPPGPIVDVILSPDQNRILARGDRTWVLEVGQPGHQTLPANTLWLGWSQKGSTVLGIGANDRLIEFDAGGSGNIRDLGRILLRENPQDISPDGTQILSLRRGTGSILVTPLTGPEPARVSRVYIQSDEPIANPRFSPDGRWVVYAAGGIYVQSFPVAGRRLLVAPRGREPEWRSDGKEIIFKLRNDLMAATVEHPGGQLRFGAPQKLIAETHDAAGANNSSRPLAVSRDGSRIYLSEPVAQPDSNVIDIKMGWLK